MHDENAETKVIKHNAAIVRIWIIVPKAQEKRADNFALSLGLLLIMISFLIRANIFLMFAYKQRDRVR